MMIARYRIHFNDAPKLANAMGPLKELADLKPGMLVKVEGTSMKDGTFLARKASDESEQLTKKPGLDKRVRLQGKIDRVDAARGSIVTMGTAFVLSPTTQILSVTK